jgi:hypothetical protein
LVSGHEPKATAYRWVVSSQHPANL